MKRHLLRGLLVTVCCLACVQIAVTIVGPVVSPTPMGEVRSEAHFSFTNPGVSLYVPLANWGIQFPAWATPVQVSLEPRSINREALAQVAGGRSVILSLERDAIQDAAYKALERFILAALVGLIIGAALGSVCLYALKISHSWRAMPLAILPGCLIIMALAGWGFMSWNPAALERPQYYASGSELPQLLKIAQQLDSQLGDLQNRAERTISSVASLLQSAPTASQPANTGTTALQVSDLHNNLASLGVLRPLSGRMPVFWVGDFSTNGVALEAPLLRKVAKVGHPSVGVSGNHDSQALMADLARAGMIVLTHSGRVGSDGKSHGPSVVKIAGLQVAGFEDPLAAKGREYPAARSRLSFDDYPDGKQREAAAEKMLWRWWRALPTHPQILMIHQAGLALSLAQRINKDSPELPLTILTGHTHHQQVNIIGNITVVDDGSVGAGGILNVQSQAGLARLHWQGGVLQSADLISLQLSSGAALATRVIPADPACDRRIIVCGPSASSSLKDEGD